jgi:hypothetical protein
VHWHIYPVIKPTATLEDLKSTLGRPTELNVFQIYFLMRGLYVCNFAAKMRSVR